MWLPSSDGNLEIFKKHVKNNSADFILKTEILAVRKYGEFFEKPSHFERFKYVS